MLSLLLSRGAHRCATPASKFKVGTRMRRMQRRRRIVPGAENAPRATQKQLLFAPEAEGSMHKEQSAGSAASASSASPFEPGCQNARPLRNEPTEPAAAP